jgi:hypothetical protein
MPLMPAVELVSTIAPPRPRSIMDGMAVSTVLNTPVRLTSMTSCHASWRSSPRAIGAMATLPSSFPVTDSSLQKICSGRLASGAAASAGARHR